MPLSLAKRLKLEELTLTNISLQMADGSITHPSGLINDILIKDGKFIFPVDFTTLDNEERVE